MRRRRRGLLADVLVGHGDRAVPDERRPAGEELVEQAARGVDVRARVHGLAAGLLGGEVLRGADDRRGLGHRVGVAHRPGDAEVHDLDVAARRQHDVAGLDVAVDDPRTVAVVQRREHARGDLQRPLGEDLATLAQDVAQRPAGDELHDDVGLGDAGPVGGGLLAGVVDGDDRGVVERRRGLRLAAEPGLERRVAGEVGAQPLDRDDAAEPRVVALAHLGHAAAAEQLAELVAAADHRRACWRRWRGRGAHGVASWMGVAVGSGRPSRPRCRSRSRSGGWARRLGRLRSARAPGRRRAPRSVPAPSSR